MSGDEVVHIGGAEILLAPKVADALQLFDAHLPEVLLEVNTSI